MQRDTRGGIAYNHSPVVVTPLTSTMTMFFRLRSAVSSFIARGFDVAPPISFVLRLDVTRCSSFAVPLFFQCYEGQRVPARVYSRPAIYPSSLSLSLFSLSFSFSRSVVSRYWRHIVRSAYPLKTRFLRSIRRRDQCRESPKSKISRGSRARTFPSRRRLPKMRGKERGGIIGGLVWWPWNEDKYNTLRPRIRALGAERNLDSAAKTKPRYVERSGTRWDKGKGGVGPSRESTVITERCKIMDR